MYQDKQTSTINQAVAPKAQWVKPQIESLDLGATEGKTFLSTSEILPSIGPS